MFAGSVIGVFILAIAIEGVRRLGREYDRKLVLDIQVSVGTSGVLYRDAERVLLADIPAFPFLYTYLPDMRADSSFRLCKHTQCSHFRLGGSS